MLDPYRMVLVNVALSAFLLIAILIYKFIFPKKKINLFVLLIVISILPVLSIFRAGTYESGDFNIHIRRAMEFYNMLSEGNIIPTWAGDLNAKYGYPLFAFDYVLPYYLISAIHFLGLSFINSLKVFLAGNFVLSGIFMYFFANKYFKTTLAAFIASVFYLFTPYHLIALHFKITIGEILAYTLTPLLFYFLHKFLSEKKIVYVLLSGFIFGLLILSHITIAIFLIPAIFVYIFTETRALGKTIFLSFKIIFIALIVSAFEWAAPLIYYPYLYTTAHPPSSFPYFPGVLDLLYAPWRFGLLFQGPKGELSFLLGYAQIAVILLALFYLFKRKIDIKQKNKVLGWLIILFISIFFITPYSFYLWKYIPLLNQSGSQRLLVTVAFYISLLAGFLPAVLNNKKWLIYGLIIFAIATTVLNWGQRRMIPEINDNVLRQDLSLGTKWKDEHFYALTKWTNPKQLFFTTIPNSKLNILKGNGTIRTMSLSSTTHVYQLNASTPLKLKENTLYFPGWAGEFNGKKVTLQPDNYGVIILNLPKENGILKITYHDLFIFWLSKVISILSMCLIIAYTTVYMTTDRLKVFSKVLSKD